MRIFISYGRKDAADLALKLAGWLRAQGYEPWLDVERGIPLGHPFDIRIEQGIAGSKLVIFLLSPWSLRPEGFCRNELLYAQAMKVPIIPVRVAEVVPPIQIISLNYVDAWIDPEAAFEKLPPIIDEVTGTGSMPLRDWSTLQPSGGWWTTYRQLDFQEELARHGGAFVGRERIFAQVRDWVKDSDSRILLLTGDAGVGKSAIAAQMTARLNVRGVHFSSRSNIESCRPAAWLSGLIYQLAAQFPVYRDRIVRFRVPDWRDPPESLFRTLIADPLLACRQYLDVGEPWIFVIDGLDESVAAAGPALADLLAESAERVPDWFRLIATSRPDQEIKAKFALGKVNRRHLNSTDEWNQEDLDQYIAGRLERFVAEQAISSGPEIAPKVSKVAAGNFLFAKMTLDALSSPDPESRLSVDEIGALPSNLGGLYYGMFCKRFRDMEGYERVVLPPLGCLVAARGQLPENLLVNATGTIEAEARKGLSLLSQFLTRTKIGLQLFHQSLADWLTDSELSGHFVVAPKYGHQRLADACWAEFRAGVATMSAYSTAHLPSHLLALDRWPELLELTAHPELNLISRWVEGGEGETGVACLTGLIRYLEKHKQHPVTSAGLATQVARIYTIRGQYGRGEEWLQHALTKTSWVRGRRIRAIALHELGSLLLYRGQLPEAATYYREALRLCRWGVPVYRDEVAANLIGLATVCQQMHRFHKAIRLADRGANEAGLAEDPRHVIAGKRLIGSACMALGRYVEAESHLKTAIRLSQSCDIPLEKARLLLLHGHLHYNLAVLAGEMPKRAKQFFHDALAEAERIFHLYCIWESKLSLGSCALAMGTAREAEAWFENLKGVIQQEMHPRLQAWLAFGLAAVIHRRGELEAAKAEYENTVGLCSQLLSRSFLCKSYVGIGAIDWHTGRPEQAQTLWKEALRLGAGVSGARQQLIQQSIRFCMADPRVVPR